MRQVAILFVSAGLLAWQASASMIEFSSNMSGSQETPPNASTGTGQATIFLDTVLQTLAVNVSFSGISVPASAAHIHCCAGPGVAAGVAGPFTGFPNDTSDSYSKTFDLTLLATYSGAFVTAHGGTVNSAEAALISGLESGLTYTNIHDATFPGGEIRGQLEPVPEPATLPLCVLGLLVFARLRLTKMLD